MKGRYMHHVREKYKSIRRGTMGPQGWVLERREQGRKRGRGGGAELKAVSHISFT